MERKGENIQEEYLPLQVYNLKKKTDMKPTESQIRLLGLISRIQSEEEAEDLCRIIQEYYLKKMDEERKRLWENGTLSDQRLEELNKEHLRVPCR